MQTIKKISESERVLTNFRDLRWRSSTTPPNDSFETFWHIKTNFRFDKFIQFKKMELLFFGLNEADMQMLIDAPGVMKDEIFLSALRAKSNNIVDSETLEVRLLQLYNLGLYKDQMSTNLYYTWVGTVSYLMTVETYAIGKIKKFSGYVRNSSSVGSKRSRTSTREPEHLKWTNASEYDYYAFFSVGELKLGTPGGQSFTLKSPNRTKRNTKINKK